MKKSAAEIEYERAIANDPVAQELQEMRRKNGGEANDLWSKAERARVERERKEMDKRNIGELQRWLAVYSDPDYFASEHVAYAKAVLAAKQEQREVRLRVAQIVANGLIAASGLVLSVVLALAAHG